MSEHQVPGLMEKGIPQKKAHSFERLGVKVEASSPAKVSGQERIGRKIGKLIREEGKTRDEAAGQAFGMARQGSLGPAAKRAAGSKPRKGR